jgi:hypothetical protein
VALGKNLHGRPLWLLETGQNTEAAQLSIGQPIPDDSDKQHDRHILPSEKREPEVLNHFREGSAEKKLGGEADETEGNDDQKKKKDHSTDLRHSVDLSSVLTVSERCAGAHSRWLAQIF